VVTVAAFLASGCADDECGSDDVRATVAALVPSGSPVHCSSAQDFEVQGRSVEFTHVEYGVQQDCPSGCFSSHVCAIEDPSLASPALYYAYWTTLEEKPAILESLCPHEFSDTQNCVTPGRMHPLVGTQDFLEFKDEQRGAGPFRWCFP
jgi:hypothetical protein